MPRQTGQVVVAVSSLDGTVAFTGFSLSSQPLGLAVVFDALIGDTAGLPHTLIVVALSSPNAVLAVFETPPSQLLTASFASMASMKAQPPSAPAEHVSGADPSRAASAHSTSSW
jgi:hypothetical protein